MKNLFKKEPRQCETPECTNVLPEDPAVIYVGEYAFDVCEECEKLMEIIQEHYYPYYKHLI